MKLAYLRLISLSVLISYSFLAAALPDLGVSRIISPISNCGLTSADSVRVEVTNFGGDPVTSFGLYFSINGLVSAPELVSESLLPGESLEYTFVATGDFSASGSFLLEAWTLLPTDADPTNDLAGTTLNPVPVAYMPQEDNFSGYSPTTTFFSDFYNDPAGDIDFEVNYGPTTSGSTGPADDASAGGGYIFMESTGYGVGDKAILKSNCIDLSTALNPSLVYSYHMYGDGIGSLTVDIVSGSNIIRVTELIGQQQLLDTDPWIKDSVDLSAYVGESIQVIFTGTIGTTGTTYHADIALDEVRISDPLLDDVGIVYQNSPEASCNLSTNENVTVTIKNFGANDQTGFDIGYNITGPTGSFTASENIGSAVIAPGGIYTHTFTAEVDFSLSGQYDVEIFSSLPGDIAKGNDTLASDFIINSISFPFQDNFNGLPDGYDDFSEFVNASVADMDFTVVNGPTPSPATGPAGDFDGTGGFIFMESTGAAPGDKAVLRSSCIDLAAGTNSELIYAYHMFGDGIGSLRVDVSDGSSVTTMREYIGQQQVSASDEWNTDTINLSAWSGQTIQVVFRGEVGTTGSPSNSDIGLDDISFSYIFSTDVGCATVDAPVSNCDLSSAEDITTTIENFGVTAATGFDVNYRVTGPGGTVNFTENVGSFSIPPSVSAPYTFTSPVDFSMDGTYDIEVWTSLSGDLGPANDSAFATIVNDAGVSIVISPWTEDFDSYATGTTVFPNMENDPTVPIEFEVNSGGTTSTGTGPDDDVTGGGNYIYMETSGSFVGDQARICTECLDLSGTSAPQVEFAYHMFGLSIGSLTVDVLAGDSSTTVTQFVGATHFSNSDPWLFGSGDLTPWINEDIRVCFTGEVGTGGFTFESDISIDEISVRELSPSDVGCVEITTPVVEGCGAGAAETVTAVIENFGTTPQTGFDVTYEMTGPGGLQTSTENIGAVTILPDSTLSFSFAATVDLSAFGTYELKVFTQLGSDLSTGNDTTTITIENVAPISVFPWTEDFEAFGVCGTTCGSDCSDFVANEWVQDETDDTDWLTDAGGTPSTGTGPIVDAVPGTALGQYLYTEASGCNNNTSILISPCFDITALAVPGLRFQYYMFGDDMGELFVDVTNDGITWTNVWSRAGQDQTSNTDPWEDVTIPLGGFTGVINFRFRGVTGPAGFESDMAIDAVTVLDIPPFDDLEVIDILAVDAACTLTNAEDITISIRNSGTDAVSGFDVGYIIDGPITASVVESVGALVVNPGTSVSYTFATTADFSTDGLYTIAAFPILASDTIADNDTLRADVFNVPTLPFPTVENFDSYIDGTVMFDWLENDPNAALDFEVNYGGTTSTTTGPSDDVSIGGGYIYMETSGSAVGDNARVNSYCIDLIGTTNPRVEFSYHMFGSSIDRLTTYVIVDTTDNILDTIVGEQHFASTDPWSTRLLDLTAYSGQTIQVAFEGIVGTGGSTFESDISIDEIRLRDPLSDDLRADASLSPDNDCQLTTTEIVSFELSNPGINTQMDFNVGFSVDGGPAVLELVTDTLEEGEQMIYTFTATADLSVEGWHTIAIWTDLVGDDNMLNDTVYRDVLHVPTLDSFPYVQDFEADPIFWAAEGDNSSWDLGAPTGAVINSASSGTTAWATNLSGNYNDSEQSAVISPCFDFSGLDKPGILLDIWWDSEAGISIAFDGAVLQSSVDGGMVWKTVGSFGDPDNWYNANDVIGNPGNQTPGLAVANGWSGDGFDGSGGYVSAQHELDGLGGEDNVKLRIAFGSDASISTFDGFAFDDVIIADMPSVSLGPDSSVCVGYVLDAGNPGATYSWSTGETTQTIVVNTTGLYTVTVTDSFGFKALDEVLLTVVPGPTVDLGPDGLICDPLVLDAGNPGASYSWSTGEITQMITVYTSGTYTVDVTDPTSLCVGTDEIVLDFGAEPDASFSTSILGPVVDFLDGSSGGITTYSWDFGDGNSSTDPNPTHLYTTSGNYLVTLIVTNPCGSDTTFATVVVVATGLDDPILSASMNLYPNPTSGVLYLEIASGEVGDALLGIYSTNGQLMSMEEINVPSTAAWTYEMDLSHLAKGNYLLRFAMGDRQASRMLTIE